MSQACRLSTIARPGASAPLATAPYTMLARFFALRGRPIYVHHNHLSRCFAERRARGVTKTRVQNPPDKSSPQPIKDADREASVTLSLEQRQILGKVLGGESVFFTGPSGTSYLKSFTTSAHAQKTSAQGLESRFYLGGLSTSFVVEVLTWQ
jgi:hypothetical protein